MDLQPDTVPGGALYETRAFTGRADLLTRSLPLGRGIVPCSRHPENQQTDPAK